MKIAILGGSFDPPHLGHVIIGEQVKEFLGMDQIWLMPAHSHPFEKNLSPVDQRFAMTKLLENDYTKVSDFEIQHNPASYTIDTLNKLKKLYPVDSFYWITGSDQLDSFQKYKNWQEIVERHNLIIFPREYILSKLTEKVKSALLLRDIPKNVIVLQQSDLILTNISSTNVRERVKKGLSIHYLVPEKVEKYTN